MSGNKAFKSVKRTLFYIAVFLLTFAILSPLIWMVLSSFKVQKDILNIEKLFLFEPIITNYVKVFAENSFATPLKNSFIIALFSSLIGLIMGLPCAYAIAKYRMKTISLVIMVIRVIPTLIMLVPLFLIFSNIGLVDTYIAMVATHLLITMPFIIWVMIPFFESIPKELEEAAVVDGAGIMSTFILILLPISIPGIITSGILSFIYSWNNFMFALVLTGKNTKTLPVAIFSFMSYSEIDWGGLMAAATVIAMPIMLISTVLQKYVITGLTSGAVKG